MDPPPTPSPTSTNTRAALEQDATDFLNNVLKTKEPCPFCDGVVSSDYVGRHIVNQHLVKRSDSSSLSDWLTSEEGQKLTNFLTSSNKWLCIQCLKIWAGSTSSCKCGCRRPPGGLVVSQISPISPAVTLAPVVHDSLPTTVTQPVDIPASQPTQMMVTMTDVPSTQDWKPVSELGDRFFSLLREVELPVLPHIPYAARSRTAKILVRLLRQVNADPDDLDSQALLQGFWKMVFRFAPEAHGRSKHRIRQSNKNFTLTRLSLFESGVVGQKQLWDEVVRYSAVSSPPDRPQQELNERRCKRLVSLNRLSDAVKALVSDGVVTDQEAVLEALKAKHPEACAPRLPIGPRAAPLQVENADLQKALWAFPRETGIGRDGLRPEFLKELLMGGRTQAQQSHLWKEVTKYVNHLLAGRVPRSLAPFVASAPVTALKKPKGGIRPIAIGEIWRRLASRLANNHIVSITSDYLQPLQVGVKVPDGAVAAVRAVRKALEQLGSDRTKVMLKIDFANAFNLASREKIFEAVRQHAPAISAWVEFCYDQQAMLYVNGGGTLLSCVGVQQGDPLGPVLFAVMLQDLVLKIKDRCLLDLNVWYLDDGTLIGDREEVLEAATMIQELGPEYGLHINTRKCELYWPTPDEDGWSEFPTEFVRCSSEGVDLLGAPIGSPAYIQNFTAERLDKICSLLSTMELMDAPQESLLLLRYCTGMPKFIYLLRTCKPDSILSEISRFDQAVHHMLEHIVLSSLDARSRDLIGLPLSDGGLGITQASHVALSAYLASEVETLELQEQILNRVLDREIHVLPLIDQWNQVHGREPISTDEIFNTSKLQKCLTNRVHLNTIAHIQGQGNAHQRTTSLASFHGHSAVWTDARPYVQDCMDFRVQQPEVFRCLLRYRLGLPLLASGDKCAACSKHHDVFGMHVASCSGIHIRLHNAVATSIMRFAQLVHLPSQLEVPHLLDDGKRPADVLIRNYARGMDLCVDVAVVCSYSDIDRASKEAGFNVARVEESKRMKYESECDAKGMLFKPFVMSTQGGFGDEAMSIIQTLAGHFASLRRLPVGLAKRMIMQTIQLDMMREFGGSLAAVRMSASEWLGRAVQIV